MERSILDHGYCPEGVVIRSIALAIEALCGTIQPPLARSNEEIAQAIVVRAVVLFPLVSAHSARDSGPLLEAVEADVATLLDSFRIDPTRMLPTHATALRSTLRSLLLTAAYQLQ